MTRIGLAVWRTILQVGGRHEILQHDLLPLGDFVELVEVDQGKRGQAQVQVMLVLEVYPVVIVVPLVPGQQNPAKAGLTAALATY